MTDDRIHKPWPLLGQEAMVTTIATAFNLDPEVVRNPLDREQERLDNERAEQLAAPIVAKDGTLLQEGRWYDLTVKQPFGYDRPRTRRGMRYVGARWAAVFYGTGDKKVATFDAYGANGMGWKTETMDPAYIAQATLIEPNPKQQAGFDARRAAAAKRQAAVR